MKVAVIAHSGKTMGGGLPELRRVLERRGVHDLRWREVPKSRKAPKQVRKALEWGAELVILWGGDGLAQRSIDALDGADVPVALIPAGTANLLASSLGVPKDIERAVDVALRGARRRIDIGRINGEAFAVMAGAGLDANMIADADGALKDRLGRLSYIWTGLKNLRSEPFETTVSVDGTQWYRGKANCVLVGNVGKLFAGLQLFEDTHEDDGMLEVGVLTATGAVGTMRTMARVAVTTVDDGANARTTKARKVKVTFDRKVLYEIDGGDREKVRSLKIKVVPGGLTVCVPYAAAPSPSAREVDRVEA
jgi:YegS/Rv2252/BmrU family lipid kinase